MGLDIRPGPATQPTPLTIFPQMGSAVVAGTWAAIAYTDSGGTIYNGFSNAATSADGDKFTQTCYLGKGTYTLNVFAFKTPDGGKLTVDIDGTDVATLDIYAAASAYTTLTQTSITISSGSVKVIGFRVNGKNGASSDYNMPLAMIEFKPTGV